MHLTRLVFVLPVALALSACGGGSNPTPPAAPAAQPKPTATVAAPAPAPVTPAKPATKQALAPLMGTWSADLASCGGANTVTVSAKAFSDAQNKCTIASIGDNGDGTFTANVTCGSAKERIQMTPVFAPTGEGIAMTYLDRGNQQVTVLRCEAPAAQ